MSGVNDVAKGNICQALLFGDAISMEFSSIRKAFGQMLLLATAGVALGMD